MTLWKTHLVVIKISLLSSSWRRNLAEFIRLGRIILPKSLHYFRLVYLKSVVLNGLHYTNMILVRYTIADWKWSWNFKIRYFRYIFRYISYFFFQDLVEFGFELGCRFELIGLLLVGTPVLNRFKKKNKSSGTHLLTFHFWKLGLKYLQLWKDNIFPYCSFH